MAARDPRMMPSLQDLVGQFMQVLGEEAPITAEPPAPAVDANATPAEAPTDRCLALDFAARGCHLEVRIQPADAPAAATILDQNGFALDAVTGVDWMAEGRMEVIYDFFHPEGSLRVAVRTRIPRANPELPTISAVFPGANWHERETHDFFGVRFIGHPDLSPFLLPEDATYHPLLKDFVAS